MSISSSTLSRALGRAAVEQSLEIARRADGVLNGRVRDVHRMRVASRRLREVLAVLAAGDVSGAKRLRRRIRRLTRALGDVRELDVMLEELAAAQERHRWADRDVMRWRRALEAKRASARERLARVLARADAEACAEACRRLAAESRRRRGPAWSAVLARRTSKRAAAVASAVIACGADYDPVRLHRLRIAVKKLRYSLELEPAAPDLIGLRETLRETQQQLGRWHDRHVLAAALSTRAGRRPSRPSRRHRAMSAETIEEECRTLHAELLAGLPSLAVSAIRVRQAGDGRAPRSTRMARTTLHAVADARRA
ncbi:MAG: CHAD domain-containing protein [Acidobacteria bacterium]|nr:CHAD domain-containing protein [Acidobacteriota bacterium]